MTQGLDSRRKIMLEETGLKIELMQKKDIPNVRGAGKYHPLIASALTLGKDEALHLSALSKNQYQSIAVSIRRTKLLNISMRRELNDGTYHAFIYRK